MTSFWAASCFFISRNIFSCEIVRLKFARMTCRGHRRLLIALHDRRYSRGNSHMHRRSDFTQSRLLEVLEWVQTKSGTHVASRHGPEDQLRTLHLTIVPPFSFSFPPSLAPSLSPFLPRYLRLSLSPSLSPSYIHTLFFVGKELASTKNESPMIERNHFLMAEHNRSLIGSGGTG